MKKLLFVMIIMSNILFASVNSMIDNILKFEGSKLEQGGGSKYGITQPTLEKYGYKISVARVTENVARQIYSKWYYEYFPKTSEPVTKILMPVTFDTSINMGHVFAMNTLVKATNVIVARKNMQGKNLKNVNNKSVFEFLGLLTESELKEINNIFVDLRVNKYVSLAKNPKYSKWKKGWLIRCESFRIKL